MKTATRIPHVSGLLVGFLCLTLATGALAQATEKVLYTFTGGDDGAWPEAGLTIDAQGNLYGTTNIYGPNGYGTVFQLTPSGGAWTKSILHAFCVDYPACNDGAYPLAGVVFDAAGNLYGTTSYGGSPQSWGVVYQLTRSGGTWTETRIRRLSGKSGDSYPAAGVTLTKSGHVFGTAEGNPVTGGFGDVFELAPSPGGGWKNRILYNFRGGNDGSLPSTALTIGKGRKLYGMTIGGGSNGSGVVFELAAHPDGTWTEKAIMDLPRKLGPTTGGLIFDAAGNLYGTAGGTVFELSPFAGGWTETILYVFGPSEGGRLSALVFDQAGNLYGTAGDGGLPGCVNRFGCGSVFKLTKTQSGWTKSTLYSFTGDTDGGDPVGGVVFDQTGNLYGVTTYGGDLSCQFFGCGVVYEITP